MPCYQIVTSVSQNNLNRMSNLESTSLAIHEPRSESRKEAPARAPPPAVIIKAPEDGRGLGRGIAILDFILRLAAIVAALAATITMGTSNQTLPFFTQFLQFRASYSNLPAFSFFVVANAIASGYLVLSLPLSIVTIVRPGAVGARLLLLILDTVMVALTTAGASAAAAIVYLAHKGNTNTNWLAICQRFGNFCERVSGAVVASFIAAFIFIVLVVVSAMGIRRN